MSSRNKKKGSNWQKKVFRILTVQTFIPFQLFGSVLEIYEMDKYSANTGSGKSQCWQKCMFKTVIESTAISGSEVLHGKHSNNYYTCFRRC